jgi:uncharacterized protein (TIGR00725 family)
MGAAVTLGVMGGAGDVPAADQLARAHALGRAAAEAGCVVVTGACPGLPLSAACGAKQAGGLVVGVSPAANRAEHVGRYASPTEFHDVLIFTGSGLMGREVVNIRSSDVVAIVGGRSGTLGELAIAYDEGKPIGVLTGMGGIGDMTAEILAVCRKNTGARMVYDADPVRLVRKLLRLHGSGPASAAGRATRPAATVVDPICGMKILRRAAVARRTRAGVKYHFCSADCAERFDAAMTDPAARPGKRPRPKKGGPH